MLYLCPPTTISKLQLNSEKPSFRNNWNWAEWKSYKERTKEEATSRLVGGVETQNGLITHPRVAVKIRRVLAGVLMVRALAHTTKGLAKHTWFASSLPAMPLVRAWEGGNQLMCFSQINVSLSLFLSLPPSLPPFHFLWKTMEKNILMWGLTTTKLGRDFSYKVSPEQWQVPPTPGPPGQEFSVRKRSPYNFQL